MIYLLTASFIRMIGKNDCILTYIINLLSSDLASYYRRYFVSKSQFNGVAMLILSCTCSISCQKRWKKKR